MEQFLRNFLTKRYGYYFQYFTGNGSTTNYSFTFEYLEQDEVKVELDGVASTAFTFANATTLSFTTAPGNGVVIRIFQILILTP